MNTASGNFITLPAGHAMDIDHYPELVAFLNHETMVMGEMWKALAVCTIVHCLAALSLRI